METALAAGVKVGGGTNYLSAPLSPMGENAVELELQVKAGCSAMDVIVSATRINAEALGLEDKLGTIEKGKPADQVVIEGNPQQDKSILRDKNKITGVYMNGRPAPKRSTVQARFI